MTCSYQQNTGVLSLILAPGGMLMLQTALPRVSPGVLLCSNPCCVHRIVYEAKITPCASVFDLTQSRGGGHTGQIAMFFSQRAVLRTRWSLAKPAGTSMPAVQLKLIPFNKYFCGGSHFSALHCHHSNNTHNIKIQCRSVLQRNGRDMHVNMIFSPNQECWASYIMPSELFL